MALADPVDLHDVGPAGQELVRHGDEVVQRHAVHRALEERRAAPRDEEEHGIVGAEPPDLPQERLRPPQGVPVREGVSRLEDLQPIDRAHRVPILRDDRPA